MKNLFTILMLCCTSFAATLYQGPGGSDDSTGLTWQARMLSGQVVFDSAKAGDTIRVGSISTSSIITVDMNGGLHTAPAIATPLYVIGCDSTNGTVLTGTNMAPIKAISAINVICSVAVVDHIKWSHIKFNGDSLANYCFRTADADGSDYHAFNVCRITRALKHGMLIRTALPYVFTNCEIDHNGRSGTGAGIASTNQYRTQLLMNRCSIHDNDSFGIQFGATGGPSVILNSVIYDNDKYGIYVPGNVNPDHVIVGNTIDGQGVGVFFTSGLSTAILENNSITNNATYGLQTSNADPDLWKVFMRYNTWYGNGTSAIDINSGTAYGEGNVTSNPLYTSTTDEAEDFTLQAGSPNLNAGGKPYGY